MTSIIYPTTNLKQVEQLNIVRGEGIYVYDDAGNKYLEGLAGLWCAALGYGNEELIDAITEQLKTLSYSHMFGGRTHKVVMQLAEKLSSMLPLETTYRSSQKVRRATKTSRPTSTRGSVWTRVWTGLIPPPSAAWD